MRNVCFLVRLAVMLALLAAIGCSLPAATPSKPAESKQAETKAAETKPAAPKEAQPAATPVAKPEPVRIKIGVQPGSQVFPIMAMQKLGLDKKYNFVLERVDFAAPAAKNNALRGGEVDIAPSGWTQVVLYRAQGVKVFLVFGANRGVTDLMVKKESPYQNVRDLKGKKIGNFGGGASTTAVILRLSSLKAYGIDPWKDATIQEGAAPLLSGLLEKGELDATMMQDPQSTTMLASGKFRSIVDLDKFYEQVMGEQVMVVGTGVTEAFAKKNPTAVTSYIRAFLEAANYMKTNDAIWDDFARELNIESPEAMKMMRDRIRNSLMTQWDDRVIGAQKRFARAAMELIGNEFLPSLPDEAFTTEYVP